MNSSTDSFGRCMHVSRCTSKADRFWAFPNKNLSFSKNDGKFGVTSSLTDPFVLPVSFCAITLQSSRSNWSFDIRLIAIWIWLIKDSTFVPSNSGIKCMALS